jgi:hypothetical protein
VRERNQATGIGKAQGPEQESPLSPRRAFVVQFRAQARGTRSDFVGRVEHVTSGQATRFHSCEDFLAFVERILADESEQPP